MTSNQRNWAVFLGAIAATALACSAYLAVAGVNDENLRIVLRVSGRIAFIVLLVVFVARPLQQMFRTPLTAQLLRNRRLLGIAFAGIHTAHLGVIMYRAQVIPDFEFSPAANLSGVLAYTLILLLFVTSFDATSRWLGPRRWRILHRGGLYILVAAFTQSQLPDSLQDLADVNWLLLMLVAIAFVIRLTAYLARRNLPRSA